MGHPGLASSHFLGFSCGGSRSAIGPSKPQLDWSTFCPSAGVFSPGGRRRSHDVPTQSHIEAHNIHKMAATNP